MLSYFFSSDELVGMVFFVPQLGQIPLFSIFSLEDCGKKELVEYIIIVGNSVPQELQIMFTIFVLVILLKHLLL
jgi:hypothetical protein